jgi:DNA-binding transcriptional ArsR family regulator
MMLRIHFTGSDLVRTRLADAPDPLWETVLSLQMLRARYGAGVFDGWRRRVRDALYAAGQAAFVKQLLFPLTPDASYFPDFLTPSEGLLGLDAGIEAVRITPRHRIRREILRLTFSQAQRGQQSWIKKLISAERDVLADLGGALVGYHHTALGPYWDRMKVGAEADYARRALQRRTGGIANVLSGFWPMMHWRKPVLEVPYPAERDLHLDGRGLVLIPSHFCWYHPVALADPALPPTIVYPLRPTADFLDHNPVLVADPPLAKLIGAARARILGIAAQGVTTSELACRADVSVASASQHAAVLRESGLITSSRFANTVVHSVTPLGLALLGRGRHERG